MILFTVFVTLTLIKSLLFSSIPLIASLIFCFISFENTTLSFSLPTKFLRDWIVNNYSDKIKSDSKKYINNIEVIKDFSNRERFIIARKN